METRVYATIGLLLVAISTAIIVMYLFDLIKIRRTKKRVRYRKCLGCGRNIGQLPGDIEVKYCPCCGEKLEKGEENA